MSSSRAVAARGSAPGAGSPAKKRPGSQAASQTPTIAQLQNLIQNPHHFSKNVGIVYFL